MRNFTVAFSDGSTDAIVKAATPADVLPLIAPRFKRGMVVGIAGARGGSPKFYMKRDDGDTAWPISAATAATFACIGPRA